MPTSSSSSLVCARAALPVAVPCSSIGSTIWLLIVYVPIAHWVWGPGGWIAEWGALDYAGGLVVEITSGASALALALVLGRRHGFKVESMRPHNLPFVLTGAGLLWFGWFGFNAGSALAADGKAAAILLNTLVAVG